MSVDTARRFALVARCLTAAMLVITGVAKVVAPLPPGAGALAGRPAQIVGLIELALASGLALRRPRDAMLWAVSAVAVVGVVLALAERGRLCGCVGDIMTLRHEHRVSLASGLGFFATLSLILDRAGRPASSRAQVPESAARHASK